MRSEPVVEVQWTSPPLTHRDGLRWALFWGGTFAALGLFDLWRNTKRDGSTLSESVRFVFNTDSAQGKATFEFALSNLTMALHRHILK